MKTYKCEWFLLIESTTFGQYIKSVMGGSLGKDAELKAKSENLQLIHVCAYGMPFHAGERWTS